MTVIKDKIIRSDLVHYDGITKTTSRKDSTGGTISGLKHGVEVDVLQVYGGGESYTKSTIQKCINAIGSNAATLVFNPGTWVIEDNITIGSNFVCRFPAGAIVSPNTGKTITFSGPVIHDAQTWTGGSGTVTENGARYFTGNLDLTGAVLQGTSPLVFEGSTANAFETTVQITDPTADRTILVPNANIELCTPRGHIAGLTLSNNASDATNDIDIAAGQAVDSTHTYVLNLASSITKRLDAAWAVGTNQGGLDTGSIANDVYHLWLIRRSDTGVVDVLFSASATSPTMPTNYDQKRRIGAIIRSGGAILTFSQFGDEFLITPVNEFNITTPSTTAQLETLNFAPDGVKVIAILNASLINATDGGDVYVLLSSPDQADVAASGTIFSLRHAATGSGADQHDAGQFHIRTNTSGQIRYRAGGTSDGDVSLLGTSIGWIDDRGKND